uniref:non-specific serine/threonine protein kinase n=1 Tax=Fagus sylvatica TaxID=28930 RepID=A0A2N9G9F1_FAGSY
MKQLETMNLSHNNLSSSIPSTFDQSTSLTSIDISYNEFEGPIPDLAIFQKAPIATLQNNRGLCGNAAGVSLIVFRRVRKIEDKPREAQNDNLFAIWSYDGKMVYKNIIAATEEFDSKYCIGVGGCGSVYKVELPTNQVVAVKKLHSVPDGETSNQKAFTSEIRALTEIRHRNIVKLYGFCSHSQHSLLVYEFLEGGSLMKLLSIEEGVKAFDWNKRANAIKELAYTMEVNEKYNVYSFGVFTLEIIMGKHPGDLISSLTSSAFTTLNMPLKEVLDQRLSLPMNEAAREVLSIAKIAIACLHNVPQSRPTMQQVSQKLSTQKLHLPNYITYDQIRRSS